LRGSSASKSTSVGARERGEDEAQVSVGLEGAGLGGLDEAVEVGAGVCAADGVGEEPVLAADDEGADRVLDEVRWTLPALPLRQQLT
jgi:hypothetical protein